MRPVEIPAGSTLRVTAWSDLQTVVGQVATTDLPPDALVPPDAVGAARLPARGEAIVGLPIGAGRLPVSGLLPRDVVEIVQPATAQTGADRVDRAAGNGVGHRRPRRSRAPHGRPDRARHRGRRGRGRRRQRQHPAGAGRKRRVRVVLIGLLSAKGAPGVTTSSLAIAAQWPRPAVVVDADPSGGDIAAGLGRGAWPAGCHLLELVARCRTQPLEAALRALVVRPGEHAPLVLAGLGSPAQAAAVPWATLGRGLARLDTVDVVCDLGRYLHGGGNRDLAEVCDRILVVTRSTPACGPRHGCASSTFCVAGRLGSRTGLLVRGAGRALSGRRGRRSVSDAVGRRAARRSARGGRVE